MIVEADHGHTKPLATSLPCRIPRVRCGSSWVIEGLYNTFVPRMKSFHFKENWSLFKGLVTDCDEPHLFFVLPGMKLQEMQ